MSMFPYRYRIMREDVDPVKVGRKALWFIFDTEGDPDKVLAQHATRAEARQCQLAAEDGHCPQCGAYQRRCEHWPENNLN